MEQAQQGAIFAPSQEQAERLLTEVREARPLGEDA